MGSDDAFASGTSDVGAPTGRSWRMADQYFRNADIEIMTLSNNDGYVMVVTMGDPPCTRRVFFDPAGRITHVR